LLWRVVLAARIEENEQEGKERHPTRVDSRAQESPRLSQTDRGSSPRDEKPVRASDLFGNQWNQS
jgi:hypothetical protein